MSRPPTLLHEAAGPLHEVAAHLHGAFGADTFGRRAESFARFFGTPRFLIGQSVLVAIWIGLNVAAISLRWDPYPFILLNLMFSLQAAYAAPLILLAQTRQADRERALSEADVAHREALAAAAVRREEIAAHQWADLQKLLEVNTRITEQIEHLTSEIHTRVVTAGGG
jgi:uncharacterized membrane protein